MYLIVHSEFNHNVNIIPK